MAGALPPVAIPSPFPLSISSDGKRLNNTQGTFFPLKGEGAWEAFGELSPSDLHFYLADRRARRFNTLILQAINPIKYVASSVAPAARGAGLALPFLLNTSGTTWDGDPTFSNFDAAFSSPNAPFFDWVDTGLATAESYGFLCVIDPIYWGFGQGSGDGLYKTIANTSNTQAVCFAFGQYIGARWKARKNIILSMGTDTFPTSGSETSARITKLQDGLISAGCRCLTLAHLQRSSGSRDYSDIASYITVRGTYAGRSSASTFGTNVARLRQEWAASPTMPTINLEDGYEADIGGGIRTRAELRTLGWHAFLSAPAGSTGLGHGKIWTFDTGWQAALSSPGSLDRQILFTLVDLLSPTWGYLEPRGLGGAGMLVTAGGGTLQTMAQASPTTNANAAADNTDGQDWVAAAVTPDLSLCVAYRPPTHTGTFTIDMTKMAGTTRRDWYDPTSGVFTSAGSALPNTGTQAFTVPGTNSAGDTDWVLVLRSP